MKRATFTLAAVIFAGMAVSQDLPPGVLLLSRVKNHIKEDLQRLPDISCLETVQREHQEPKGKMGHLDTIRLEVLTNGHKELYASPGDRKFSEHHPMSFAGSGMLGNGFFGLYLKDILLSNYVSDTYKGEEEVGGRRLARYDYRLPLMWSGERIQTVEGSGQVGLHGSYWIDPQTYDVVRLELNADDIPPTLPITEAVTSINYARTLVGNNLAVLLPESAEVRLAKFSGEIYHNRMEFTHCRAFEAESTINFDAPDSAEQTPRFGVASVDDTLRPLPAGLQIAVKLRTRISDDMAVGALIDGVVGGNVSAKGVVIAAGSPVRGRLRRLERYTDPFPYFVVALEFTEVELQGIRYRFYAEPVEIEPLAGLEQTLTTKDTTESRHQLFGDGITDIREIRGSREAKENVILYNLPGVVTFFFKGGKLDLPQGFRTVWKTRPLTP
jgi:hypothetical protein